MVDAVTDSDSSCGVCGSPVVKTFQGMILCTWCADAAAYALDVTPGAGGTADKERARFARLPEDLQEIISNMDVHALADVIMDLHEKNMQLTTELNDWKRAALDWENRALRAERLDPGHAPEGW